MSTFSRLKPGFCHYACLILSLGLAVLSPLEARVFTDNKGRTTDAELSGVEGDMVYLRKNGVTITWPIARLSPPDQIYVKEWQANPPATPKVFVRAWEKKGFSSAGTFSEEATTTPGLPSIPGLHEVDKRASFYYFDVDVSNTGKIAANHLTLSYQMYVINPAGQMIVEVGSESLPLIQADGRITASTKAISSSRTKTTTLKLTSLNSSGATAVQDRSTKVERFGGGWIRVYAHDGTMVGETVDLHPEIERMKPSWLGPEKASIGTPGGLDEFDGLVKKIQEQLQKLREMLTSLPPLPEPKAGDSEGPGQPPGPPKPPGFPPR